MHDWSVSSIATLPPNDNAKPPDCRGWIPIPSTYFSGAGSIPALPPPLGWLLPRGSDGDSHREEEPLPDRQVHQERAPAAVAIALASANAFGSQNAATATATDVIVVSRPGFNFAYSSSAAAAAAN